MTALPEVTLSGSSLTRRRKLLLLVALLVLSGVFGLSAKSWVQFAASNGGPVGLFTQTDFPGVLIGARMVSAGRGAELYDLNAQLAEQQRIRASGYLALTDDENTHLKYPYPYPPFLAVLWSPLSGLQPLSGMALYDILNILAMAAGLWVLLWSLPLPGMARLVIMLAGLTCFPFIVNLEQGQSSGIVLFSFATGVALLRRGHDLPAGLVLGLLVLKVQWLPLLVLVLIWKRRWSALAGLVSVALALSLLVLSVSGTGWIPGYLSTLQMAQRFAPELLLGPQYSHSLTGLLASMMSTDAIRGTILAATVVVAGLLLSVWRGRWRAGEGSWDGAMALTVLGTAFTNLQLNTHDLCLLVLPAALGTSYVYRSGAGHRIVLLWNAVLWASYLVFMPSTLFTEPLRLTSLMIALMLVFLGVMLTQRRSNPELAEQTALAC